MIPLPPDTLSGNHLEPVLHLRMISRSEHRALYNVRSPFTFHLLVMLAVYLLFLPPYSPVDPAATVDYTATVYDYVVNDSTPYRRASRQATPLPLSHISPTCLYLSVALGICCCYVTLLFNCIACHCRHLFTFPISYADYINIYITQQ